MTVGGVIGMTVGGVWERWCGAVGGSWGWLYTVAMRLEHQLGQSVSLFDEARGVRLWSYVYRGKPKPFFHPVCTPSGICLTNFEPTDHVWHRGLWFTFKFINGENFWEEKEPYGTQKTIGMPTLAPGENGGVNLFTRLEWVRPGEAGVVFQEQRQIGFVPIDERMYAIDFFTVLTASADLVLDRTVFTTWGGYGGLIFRGTRNWQETRILLSNGTSTDRPIGVPALWGDVSGRLDGGFKLTGGYAMFDHPENARHPTPWYGGTAQSNYLNAAMLFHEPLNVGKGEQLALRYRVVVHDGMLEAGEIQGLWENWARSAKGEAVR